MNDIESTYGCWMKKVNRIWFLELVSFGSANPNPMLAKVKSDATTQSLIGIWVKQTTVAYFCLLDIFWDLGERSGAEE